MKKVTIIVPCYNEQESLPYFYQETVSVLQKINYDYEFLFVNDGSKDGTLPILRELAAQDEHITYLSFSRNFGKEAAMFAGFCNASGDYGGNGCRYAGSAGSAPSNAGNFGKRRI